MFQIVRCQKYIYKRPTRFIWLMPNSMVNYFQIWQMHFLCRLIYLQSGAAIIAEKRPMKTNTKNKWDHTEWSIEQRCNDPTREQSKMFKHVWFCRFYHWSLSVPHHCISSTTYLLTMQKNMFYMNFVQICILLTLKIL